MLKKHLQCYVRVYTQADATPLARFSLLWCSSLNSFGEDLSTALDVTMATDLRAVVASQCATHTIPYHYTFESTLNKSWLSPFWLCIA